MGLAQRNRGKRGERQVVALTHGLFVKHDDDDNPIPLTARRGQQHRGGPDSPDIIHNVAGTHWEVTLAQDVRPGTAAMIAKVIQARLDAQPHEVPWIWHRRNGTPADLWWVTLPMVRTGNGSASPAHEGHLVTMHYAFALSLAGWHRAPKSRP